MSLAAYLLTYGAALLGLALVAAYLFFSRKYDHWKKKGVKHLKPLPFVGNFKDIALGRKNIGMVVSEIYEQHKKEPYLGLYAFDQPLLLINDLNLLRATLVKDAQYFCDRSLTPSPDVDPYGARSLFGLKGEHWRNTRNAITPSFSSGKMRRMYELIAECGRDLQDTVEREAGNGKPVAVYELVARYTTDVISSCAFGIQGNSLADPEAEFRRVLKSLFQFSAFEALMIALVFIAPKLLEVLPTRALKQDKMNYLSQVITSTIKERELYQIKRNDLLDSLIELKNAGRITDEEESPTTKPHSKVVLDEQDVTAHSVVFLTAGFETSATTINYILYELALHSDVQDKLRAEIHAALSDTDDKISYETLHGLKYLDMVMQEALRKYPPLPFLDRMSNQAYTLPGTNLTLEKESRIIVPVLGIQMDPEYYPNPKFFDPERFSEANKKNNLNYTHMPFGEGPRSCVGIRFAVVQTKAAVAHIVAKYSVHPCGTTPLEVEPNPHTFFLQPKTPIELVFRKI